MPPTRTPEQRAEALAAAARQRAALAQLRQQLAAGDVHPCRVLEGLAEHPEWGAMPVRRFLEAIPHVGQVRAAEYMSLCGVASNRRLRGIGVSQRAELVRILQPGGAESHD